MFNTLRLLVPTVQALVEDDIYNISANWTTEDGLSKKHTLKVGYTYNDEELALLKGIRQEDGSYVYISPKGRQHLCPADKASAYVKAQAEKQAAYQVWQQAQQPAVAVKTPKA
tara:strand:- start:139 stop:477 length:339 start_codon:yes stop_codon:yes gene_type:complete